MRKEGEEGGACEERGGVLVRKGGECLWGKKGSACEERGGVLVRKGGSACEERGGA